MVINPLIMEYKYMYIYILVGGLEHVLFSISYMGSSFPLTFMFFKMVRLKTPTRYGGFLSHGGSPSHHGFQFWDGHDLEDLGVYDLGTSVFTSPTSTRKDP